jgi:Holliday junction resolvase RusA-like endonuclease
VAKITRFGSFIPKETRAEMDACRAIARVAMAGREPFLGPVELKLAAYMPVPASWSRRKREAALGGRIFPTSKPDGSNIQKLVEDAILPPHLGKKDRQYVTAAMMRTVIKDDSQITDWRGWKRYSDNPRIVIEVREIDLTARP